MDGSGAPADGTHYQRLSWWSRWSIVQESDDKSTADSDERLDVNRIPVPAGPAKLREEWQPRALLHAATAIVADVSGGMTVPAPRLYIVVDELIGDHLTLAVARWPRVDERGRLRFPRDAGRWRIGATTAEFASLLFVHRVPEEHETREIRIGDVFAASEVEGTDLDRLNDEVVDPWDWISPPVVDVTSEARSQVKAAFYSAVAPALRPRDNQRDARIVENVKHLRSQED